ncbi:hypothetical protein BCR44DRAFT_1018247 [Catenaria anguillulae PL171]|uniref:Uncharacterized protein n=1 Tax=Catenaria anguillulae PL171 TaxID=765915 RepID=A0A1Y2H6K0_9FUNG|nr:hypothetical protein BCR44DRAFT_1018247 [Catenaria anguillulae PL171]
MSDDMYTQAKGTGTQRHLIHLLSVASDTPPQKTSGHGCHETSDDAYKEPFRTELIQLPIICIMTTTVLLGCLRSRSGRGRRSQYDSIKLEPETHSPTLEWVA